MQNNKTLSLNSVCFQIWKHFWRMSLKGRIWARKQKRKRMPLSSALKMWKRGTRQIYVAIPVPEYVFDSMMIFNKSNYLCSSYSQEFKDKRKFWCACMFVNVPVSRGGAKIQAWWSELLPQYAVGNYVLHHTVSFHCICEFVYLNKHDMQTSSPDGNIWK